MHTIENRLLWLGTACALLTAGCLDFGGVDLADASSGDTDADTDADTDTDTDSDADTDTDTDSDTDTGTGTDTGPPSCVGVSCQDPPPVDCIEIEPDAGVDGGDDAGPDGGAANGAIEVHNETGWCEDGECVYPSHVETCEGGDCADGLCVDYPCQGYTCNDPPPSSCEDDTTLRVYTAFGTCEPVADAPECSYGYADVTCTDGCDASHCVDNPCAAVTCDDPPARYCEGDTLVLFNTIGQCADGECSYASQTVDCGSDGCSDGQCTGDDPCTAVTCATPPASYCIGDTLRSFAVPGVCDEGACTYAPIDTACTSGCSGGSCVGDPCAAVTCNTPPASYCADDTYLVHWDGTGACVDGLCEYGTVQTECSGACLDGLCTDPCEGVICATPPASHCDGATAVSFETPGSCVGDGFCEYAIVENDCPGGCLAGECQTNQCTDGGGVCVPIVDSCITCDDGWAPMADYDDEGETFCYEGAYCCLPHTPSDMYCEQNDGICIPAATWPATDCPPGWTNGAYNDCCAGTDICTGVQCCYPC